MDGRSHETSMRLIAASIPAQALMMVGVAALVLGAASHGQPAPAIQVSPGQVTKPAPAYVDPGQTCWPKQPGMSPPGAMSPGDRKQEAMTCVWLQSVPGSAPDRVRVTVTVGGPCCGG
jgi:hypothetical protein